MVDPVPYLRLGAPVGEGQENNPDDVEALDWAIRRIEAYSPPPEYRDGPQRYPTTPMIDAVRRLQSQNALLVDGAALPGGPTERLINNALLAKPRGASLLFAPIAPLGGDVGDGRENRRADVSTVQRLLGALGHMPEDPFDRPHGLIDGPTLDGVKSFQRRKGLTDDGWIAPGGETERALFGAAADLARANGPEWVRFADRAGRAQASVPSAFQPSPLRAGIQPGAQDRNRDDRPEAPPDAGVIPAQSRRLPGTLPAPIWPWTPRDQDEEEEIVPGSPADVLRRIFETLGRGGRYGVMTLPRASLPESDRPGSRVENIPPRVPDGPFRGPDPAKPPLDPKETRPAPYPAEPPTKLPDRVENIPPRIDPREGIERYPDQSDESRKMPNVFIMEEARLFDRDTRDKYMREYREWHDREGWRIEQRHQNDGVRQPVRPSESFIWNKLDWHRPDQKIKRNGLSGKDRRYYVYDYGGNGTHRAQIEVWDRTGRKHLGAIDPVTGRFVSGPDKSKRPIDIHAGAGADDRDFV